MFRTSSIPEFTHLKNINKYVSELSGKTCYLFMANKQTCFQNSDLTNISTTQKYSSSKYMKENLLNAGTMHEYLYFSCPIQHLDNINFPFKHFFDSSIL